MKDVAPVHRGPIASPEFAVDRQIEQRQFPGAAGQLKSNPDCPDFL
jgi:hypothetical protein